MYGAVHVAADVIDEVVAGEAHQVGGDHPAVVFRLLLAEIGVDRGEAHGDRAGAVDACLVDEGDFYVVAHPALHLECSTASGHAATDDEDVCLVFNDFGIAESGFAHVCFLWNYLLAETRGLALAFSNRCLSAEIA